MARGLKSHLSYTEGVNRYSTPTKKYGQPVGTNGGKGSTQIIVHYSIYHLEYISKMYLISNFQ